MVVVLLVVGGVAFALGRRNSSESSAGGPVAASTTVAAPTTTAGRPSTSAPTTSRASTSSTAAGNGGVTSPPACTGQGLVAAQDLDRQFNVESFGCTDRIVTAAGVPTSAFAWAVMRSHPYTENGSTVTPGPMLLYFSDTDSNGNPQGHWQMEAYVLADPTAPGEGGGWQACDALMPNAGCEALVAAGLDPTLAGR